MASLSERNEACSPRVHVSTRVSEREGRDWEVGEEIDALEVGCAHRSPIRTFVQGAEWRGGCLHHV